MITKSDYVGGLRCPKALWYETHEPEKLAEETADDIANQEEGTRVGELARTLYPEGILIEGTIDEMVAQTQQALGARQPLFEAAFRTEGELCLVDLLVPAADGWNMVEVKKSTKVKPSHITDAAFQHSVATATGLPVSGVSIMHINRGYVRDGPIEVTQLFASEDITEAVNEKDVRANIERVAEIINGSRPAHERVHECVYSADCRAADIDVDELPEFNLTQLFYAKKKGIGLVNDGIVTFDQLGDVKLNEKQQAQRDAVLTGSPFVNRDKIDNWLAQLTFPLYHLDFETFGGALPPLDGMQPYKQVPFQVSLHIEHAPGNVEHFEYLGDGGDPRPGVIDILRKIGPEGSLVAYSASVEKGCITKLAAQVQGNDWLLGLNDRFVDLMVPFRNCWYYDRSQKGRYSIKVVLPALVGDGYAGMEINNGLFAQQEYERITQTDVEPAERQRVRTALLDYCRQDTRAMVDIIAALR